MFPCHNKAQKPDSSMSLGKQCTFELKTTVRQLPPRIPVPPLDSLRVPTGQKLKQDRGVSRTVRPQTGPGSGALSEPSPREQSGHHGLTLLPPEQENIFTAEATKVHSDLSALLHLLSEAVSSYWSLTKSLLVPNSHNSIQPPYLLPCDCLRGLSIHTHRVQTQCCHGSSLTSLGLVCPHLKSGEITIIPSSQGCCDN